MGFEEISFQSSTTISLPTRSEHHDTIPTKATETSAVNNIVKGPQSATSPTLPIPSLVVDAALITTLVAGISTGILLELPENALPPLEQFQSLIAGAILADNPNNYGNQRAAEIPNEIFIAPELSTAPKKTRHSTPCSPLSTTMLSKKAQQLNRSWQRCLAPEISPLSKKATHSSQPLQHQLDKPARAYGGKR